MLDTALRILHASEGVRADARRHEQTNSAEHACTQLLLRELGGRLGLAGHIQVAAAAVTCSSHAGIAASRSEEVAEAPAIVGSPDEVDTRAGHATSPSLEIYLLSPFCVFANDRAINEWPNCKGKAIFKYLATHRGRPVPKEVLMEVFWPGSDQYAARNNLNVAIYGLRKALSRADPDFAFVLFRQGCYSFNAELRLWVDAEAFIECVHRAQVADQRGHASAAVSAYRAAQAVYHGALLIDDRYEDWLIPQRQSLQDTYLKVLARLSSHDFDREDFESCAASTAKMLDVDKCNEEAHRLLMRCYSRMGHTHLALRQYHFCVEALARELNLIPSPQTVALFQQIRHRQAI